MVQKTWCILLMLVASAAASALGVAEGQHAIYVGLYAGGAGILVWLACSAFYHTPELEGEAPKPVEPGDLPEGFGRALLEQIPAPLLLIGNVGRIIYANTAAHELIPRVAVGTHFSVLFRAPAFVDGVRRCLDNGSVEIVDFTVKQGLERHLTATINPLPPGGDFGEGPNVIVQIDDRTEDVRIAQMRSDFIANASHELKTPLASILGYIETLRGHAKDDPEAQARFLGIMEGQANRMQRLVKDLLSLNRIEISKNVPPEDHFDLCELVRDACASFEPLAAAEGRALEVALPEDPQFVVADRDQLHQVWSNLLENALKYGREGTPIRVVSQSPDPRFPDMAGLSVIDQGDGIPRDHLHRLTERFYRVSTKKSREKGGTGLGLAIVKHILNRHGAELEIKSNQGVGSEFTIWFPQSRERG